MHTHACMHIYIHTHTLQTYTHTYISGGIHFYSTKQFNRTLHDHNVWYTSCELNNRMEDSFGNDLLLDGTIIKVAEQVAYMPSTMGRMNFVWGEDALEYKLERWPQNGTFCFESPSKFTLF